MFFLRLRRRRVTLIKESSQVFLLNLNRGHLRLGHDLLALEERNLTDRQLTNYSLLIELIKFVVTYALVDQKIVFFAVLKF